MCDQAGSMTMAVLVTLMLLCLAPTWVAATIQCNINFTQPGDFTHRAPVSPWVCPTDTAASCDLTIGVTVSPQSSCGGCTVESAPFTSMKGQPTTPGNVLKCANGFKFIFDRQVQPRMVEIHYPNSFLVNSGIINPLWECHTMAPTPSPTFHVEFDVGTLIDTVRVCYSPNPACDGQGGVCGDPEMVGGDGVKFYFHGRKDQDFCLVSDRDLHINAHFIGKRPAGRTRDFTWVQALGFVFGPHTFTVAAKRVGHWSNSLDQLEFSYNGKPFQLDASSTWLSDPSAAITLTRIGAANAVDLVLKDKMGVTLTVVPVGKKKSEVHWYGITGDDCFAHFDMQFRFFNLSSTVHGVLGQTYQPGFVSPVKRGAVRVMGGPDQYRSSSLLATDCAVSQYTATGVSHGSAMPGFTTACGSYGLPDGIPGGMACRN